MNASTFKRLLNSIILAIFICFSAKSQSPRLSIILALDPTKAKGARYKIEMKICEPQKMSKRGNLFSPDTSKIDFASLKSTEINCGKYSDNNQKGRIFIC